MSDWKPDRPELISHHVFLLPFKWQKEGSQAYDIADFAALVNDKMTSPQASRWGQRPFTQKRITDYNEVHYFYDYVREVLYQTDTAKVSRPEELFIAHYEYDIKPGSGTYCILAPHPFKDGKKEYHLEIDSVLLHLYYTGVGILSFHLNNRSTGQRHPKHILAINQYGRRVFPNFYKIPFEKVGFQAAFDEVDSINNHSGGLELAYQIEVKLGLLNNRELVGDQSSKYNKDDYCCTENWPGGIEGQLKETDNYYRFRMPKILEPFIGFIDEGYDISPIIDDRMFVLCWYGNDHLARRLTKSNHLPAYLLDDWWYRYLFVDSNGLRTIQNSNLQKQMVRRATYTRWTGLRTLYGVSEYSFVLLTDSLPTLRSSAAFLVTHFQTIYYRLAELVLLQRASIQRFSDDVTHITRIDGSDVTSAENGELTQADLARRLDRRYIRFVNRIYFREATPQQQGIELYDLLQQQARVPQQVHALQEEIERLRIYVQEETDRALLKIEKERKEIELSRERVEEERRNIEIERRQKEQDRYNILTLLGAVFLAPSLIVATYSLSYVPDCFANGGIIAYGSTLMSAILSGLMTYDYFRGIPKWRMWMYGVVLIVLMSMPWIVCKQFQI